MVLYSPSASQVVAAAARRGLSLTEAEGAMLAEMGEGLLRSFERIDGAERATLPTSVPRSPGRVPTTEENPHNGWVWRCEIASDTTTGPLAGRSVVVKDIVPVAGQPMTGGSAILQGYTATFDATVVTRVLDAGGTIAGIATTEDLCMSAASVSAASGQVRNPRDPSRSAGGSSSGVAALVASGAVDVGIGADQGGSIRIPSSLTGIFGMKPTYGLVPYTGAAPIDVSADHLGPMARTSADLAALLQAIAGFDAGRDPRQRADFTVGDYVGAAERRDLTGLRVGVLKEGFDLEGEPAPVDVAVREGIEAMRALGAEIVEVSVPRQELAIDLQAAILIQGASEFMMRGAGTGLPGKGFFDEQIGQLAAGGLSLHGDQLFAAIKYCMGMGGYLWDAYGGSYYAKAQNLALALRADYDAVLENVDVLVLPTTRSQAKPLPDEDAPGLAAVELAQDASLIRNTCAFNHTGHPALSVPVGPVDGLPVGMMLVGSWYAEETLIGVAAALEAAGATQAQLA
ncbi:amidase [Demequina sp. NBRC 110054]|uniref:amidase n=1 Tax=Demequina sp. NBRC 110054 TaxID=1570343 RepID=UPI000A03F098|nr:amidase [Demequina sp. NBRC 110054]